MGLDGLRLRKAERKTLVSRTARSRSVNRPVPVDGRAFGDSFLPELLTDLGETGDELLSRHIAKKARSPAGPLADLRRRR